MYKFTKAGSDTTKTVITLAGAGGSGKTSLAASFEKPIFIRVEDGTRSLTKFKNNAEAFDFIRSEGGKTEYEVFLDQLRYVYSGEHNFKTLVIDSISRLDTLMEKHLHSKEPNKPFMQLCGGFGSARNEIASMHNNLLDVCNLIKDKRDMNIVFISHLSEIEKTDILLGISYTAYDLSLRKGISSVYINNCDGVYAIYIKTYQSEDKLGSMSKVKPTDKELRYLKTHSDESKMSFCKDRLGFGSDDIPFALGENPIKALVEVKEVKEVKSI